MTKPRTKNGNGVTFPFVFEKNGRKGRIKKWADDKFGTYFMFAGEKIRNSFKTFEAAFEYLDAEFSKLDADAVNSTVLHPVNHSVKVYAEMEQRLKELGNGASLLEAVNFYVLHHETKQFKPRKVQECIELALEAAKGTSISNQETLAVHYRAFAKEFGTREIHRVTAEQILAWLTKRYPNPKTQKNVRGSIVQLFKHAHDILKAIPEMVKVEPQKIKTPKTDKQTLVEIYTPDEMEKWLLGALEHDIDLIPLIVTGGFEGLRPSEIHGERSRNEPLDWNAYEWNTKTLHVSSRYKVISCV
jgi:hypothetical protein